MVLQRAATKLLAPENELSGALRGYFKGPRLVHMCSLPWVCGGVSPLFMKTGFFNTLCSHEWKHTCHALILMH